MKKILYLSELEPNGKFGGSLIEDRNRKILEKNYDLEIVGVYALGRGKLSKMKDLVFSKVPTLYSSKDVRKIKNIIKKSTAEYIFIETSKMGYFAKYAKKCGKKIISFLHNCEAKLYGESRGKLYVPFIKKQERLTLKYSDYIIFLNERDKKVFLDIYNDIKINKSKILPISFDDKCSNDDINHMMNKKKGINGVFLGSLFGPNYNGIKWFCDNVSDSIFASVDIVGFNFEKCTELKRNNINVIGTVDNVKDYILDADFVVLPIFEGSGMKVKTCECLMYGKRIFASDEALEGYDLDSNQVFRCNTKEEFSDAINSYIKSDLGIYNPLARDAFVNKYSNTSVEAGIKDIIDNL